MYVILVHDDNSLSAPVKERIMQRSKLVDTLCFLSHPIYKGYDMTNCSVLLEYVLPVSKEYISEILTLSDEMYEDHLKYLLPIDTSFTSEAGEIELQLTFALADLDEKGNPIQRVRKTDSITVNIVPISAWSNIIPDSALNAIDQLLIKTDAQIKALNDIANTINDRQVDDLDYNENTNELQLMAGKVGIGKKVVLNNNETKQDGTPVVDFSNYAGDFDDEEESNNNASEVVEF